MYNVVGSNIRTLWPWNYKAGAIRRSWASKFEISIADVQCLCSLLLVPIMKNSYRIGFVQGFDSVMVDGSHLSFTENLSYTKSITELARSKNIMVEAELGRLSGTEDGLTVEDYEAKLTSVHQVLIVKRDKFNLSPNNLFLLNQTTMNFVSFSGSGIYGNWYRCFGCVYRKCSRKISRVWSKPQARLT